MSEQRNEKESPMLAHLGELKVKTDIAVNKPEKKKEVDALAKNTFPIRTPPKDNGSTIKTQEISRPSVAPEEKKAVPGAIAINATPQSPIRQPVSNNTAPSINKEVARTAVVIPPPQSQPVSQPVVQKNQGATSIVQASPPPQKPIQQPVIQKTEPPVVVVPEKEKPRIENSTSSAIPVAEKKTKIAEVKTMPSLVSTRSTESIQEIYFKGDSLVLALYDNGIVDGDTVSVYLNGENIISKQKLKEAATKKTIYITPGMPDVLELVLFADNLGSIPPNSGLLTIRDGEDVFQVRFSADLSKNAKITLRRKRP